MEVFICRDMNWLFSDDAFSIYSSCMCQPTFDLYKSKMEHFVSDPSIKIFVCEDGDKKVGILVLNQSNTTSEILGIAVSERRRSQGIGKYMIHQVIKSEGLNMIKAETDSDTVGFYRKCGFSDDWEVKNHKDDFSVQHICYYSK